MLHPSYADLMKTVNSEVEEGEQPVVNSRYSIVLATSKRARQIIDGAHPLVEKKDDKPLSIAVEELSCGKVKIIGDSETEEAESAAEIESTVEAEDKQMTETALAEPEEAPETTDKAEISEENGAAEDDSQPTEEA